MNMERKLKKLFDFQRFEKNPRLQCVINRVDESYAAAELSDYELSMLSAAGDANLHAAEFCERGKERNELGRLKSGRNL